MSNIDEYGTLFIGGFCKTLADLREIVERADYYGLPDSTRCNGAVSLRVEGKQPWCDAGTTSEMRIVKFLPDSEPA